MSSAGKRERSSKSGRFKTKHGKGSSTVKSERVRSANAELQRSYQRVELPVETVGECKYSLTCNQFTAVLGNGLCEYHWDIHPSGQTV